MGLCISKRDILIERPRSDSPSASMDSSTVTTVTEKCLLKNSSIGSSFMRSSSASNAAECGSSTGWRLRTQSDELLEGRTSGFSYLSSPTMEGIDLDSTAKSTAFSSRLLEIDEEHVFGGSRRATAGIKPVKNGGNKDLDVFGAEHYFGTVKNKELPVFSGCESEPDNVEPVRSARWGFFMDSFGTDEMEERHNKFMAVPRATAAVWGQQMPVKLASRSVGSYSDSDMESSRGWNSNSNSNFGLNSNLKYATASSPASSFSSSMVYTEDDGPRFHNRIKTSLHRHRKAGTTDEEEDDSDTSDDLFEIGNLGTTTLSSSSRDKEFVCPMSSRMFKDPDISHGILGVKNGMNGMNGILRAAYGPLPRQQRFQKHLPPRQQRRKSFTTNAIKGHLDNGTRFYGR